MGHFSAKGALRVARAAAVALGFVVCLTASNADAFPWMVRHNYASCAACHVDPSGAGQLTQYGRAQSDVLLRWKPGKTKDTSVEEELPKSVNFLWFLEMPEAVNISGNLRGGALIPVGGKVRPVIMATDLYATVNVDRFVFHVTTGVGLRAAPPAGSGAAAILPRCDLANCGAQWIAREYWAGAKFADEALMVRVGRIPLPFGLRNNEHVSWVRDFTNTDVNADQQLGASLAYNSDKFRGELMAIAGNYQMGPDVYRRRGYSMFGEFTVADRFFLGLSSQMNWAGASDTTGQLGLTARNAHGLFARWSPVELVALLAEVDLIAHTQAPFLDRIGFAAFAQADFELMQGLHVMATLEGKKEGPEQGVSVGVWGSAAWYFLPHVELRVDAIYKNEKPVPLVFPGDVATPTAAANSFTMLLQLHLFL